jgi:hypothetical protein
VSRSGTSSIAITRPAPLMSAERMAELSNWPPAPNRDGVTILDLCVGNTVTNRTLEQAEMSLATRDAHLKNSRARFLCIAEQGIDSEQKTAYCVACVARSSAQASQRGGAPFLPQRFTAIVVIACPRRSFFSSKSHRALSEAALPASRATT